MISFKNFRSYSALQVYKMNSNLPTTAVNSACNNRGPLVSWMSAVKIILVLAFMACDIAAQDARPRTVRNAHDELIKKQLFYLPNGKRSSHNTLLLGAVFPVHRYTRVEVNNKMGSREEKDECGDLQVSPKKI